MTVREPSGPESADANEAWTTEAPAKRRPAGPKGPAGFGVRGRRAAYFLLFCRMTDPRSSPPGV